MLCRSQLNRPLSKNQPYRLAKQGKGVRRTASLAQRQIRRGLFIRLRQRERCKGEPGEILQAVRPEQTSLVDDKTPDEFTMILA